MVRYPVSYSAWIVAYIVFVYHHYHPSSSLIPLLPEKAGVCFSFFHIALESKEKRVIYLSPFFRSSRPFPLDILYPIAMYI
jgi:hypothetical protein